MLYCFRYAVPIHHVSEYIRMQIEGVCMHPLGSGMDLILEVDKVVAHCCEVLVTGSASAMMEVIDYLREHLTDLGIEHHSSMSLAQTVRDMCARLVYDYLPKTIGGKPVERYIYVNQTGGVAYFRQPMVTTIAMAPIIEKSRQVGRQLKALTGVAHDQTDHVRLVLLLFQAFLCRSEHAWGMGAGDSVMRILSENYGDSSVFNPLLEGVCQEVKQAIDIQLPLFKEHQWNHRLPMEALRLNGENLEISL